MFSFHSRRLHRQRRQDQRRRAQAAAVQQRQRHVERQRRAEIAPCSERRVQQIRICPRCCRSGSREEPLPSVERVQPPKARPCPILRCVFEKFNLSVLHKRVCPEPVLANRRRVRCWPS